MTPSTTRVFRATRIATLLVATVFAYSFGTGRPSVAGDADNGGVKTSSGSLAAPPVVAGAATSTAGKDAMSNFKKPDESTLRGKLSALQFQVTQEEGTEAPFRNEYWDNHEDGLYVDVVSGEVLFSSKDKFESGTGWPSFTQPLEPANITERTDSRLFATRTEVRSKHADSHLGHVFPDGPKPTGMRYCMNSASMRFVPANQLEAEGYGQYAGLFGAPSAAPSASTDPAPKGAAYDGNLEIALLAGGCFWGVEELIRALPGVVETDVGYTGGTLDNATYNDVKRGNTGHAEGVRIKFDPARVSYDDILRFFFRLHDPTTLDRQGNDVGLAYRSAIFVLDDRQRTIAEKVKAEVGASGKWKSPVVTEIVSAGPFWLAEDYHQDYLQKDPGGYTCHWLRD